jgi:hypothetical protein
MHLAESTPQVAIVARATKRTRADSSLMAGTGTPGEMTSARSEAGTASSGVSDVAPITNGNQCRNKTKLRPLNAIDPESKLGKYIQ